MESKQVVWKSLDGIVENGELYEVSKKGQVRNAITKRILKPGATNGYLYVGLRLKSSRKYYYIHRLVALAFIENSENKETVNHINGIKADNRIENLEWASMSEQQRHAVANGLSRKGESHQRAFIYDSEALLISLIKCATREQIADAFSCSIQTVDQIRAGSSRKAMKELSDQLDGVSLTLDEAITARAYFRYFKTVNREGTECN